MMLAIRECQNTGVAGGAHKTIFEVNMKELYAQENGWIKIASIDDWGSVDGLIKGGHDGVIKDLHWSHGEYVDPELNMVFDGKPTIWILLQLQNEPVSSAEFLLTGVEEFHLSLQHELVFGAEIRPESVNLQLSGNGRSYIQAQEIFYRIPEPPLLGNLQFDCS
jgi:hypothetical protein